MEIVQQTFKCLHLMRMKSRYYLGYLIVLSQRLAMALKISLYTGENCTSSNNGVVVLGPDQGCQTQGVGVAASAVIESTGVVDDTFYAVLFSSNDCNPDTVLAKGDQDCVSANYHSFAVWNVCAEGRTDCIVI